MKVAVPLAILNIVWWVVSIVYSQFLLTAYKTNFDFRNALLSVDGISLTIVFALIPIAYTIWKEKDRESEGFKFLIRRILNLVVSLGILILCNVATYLFSGIIDDFLIFYQLWQAPASVLIWHTLLRTR